MATAEITIDEKACRGCSLCVEICPTQVFHYSESDKLAVVDNASQCFGCLSCSEICPSGAIIHHYIDPSESYYHDAAAMDMITRLGEQVDHLNLPKNTAKIENALTDLGIRLLSVASVLKHTLGQSLPAIGTMAGRSLAFQLPSYQKPRNLKEAFELAQLTFAPAWDLECQLEDDNLSILVGECFVRTLCRKEGIEIGGDLCILFYNYLAGYLGKICSVRPRLMGAERGEACLYKVRLYNMPKD